MQTLAEQFQDTTGESVEVAFVDQGDSCGQSAQSVVAYAIKTQVFKLPETKKGFVLLPRPWEVELSIAWVARLRCPARDYKRVPETSTCLHFLAFVILLLRRFADVMAHSS